MTQVVNIPGVGKLNFPDGMSQADMAAAIQRNFPQIHGAQQPRSLDDTIPGQDGKLYNQDGSEYAMRPAAPSAPAQESPRWADRLSNAMPDSVRPFTDPVIGAGEMGLSGVTNLFGKAAGGVAGLGQMAMNPTQDPNEGAANTMRSVENYFTYQPGARGTDLAGGLAEGAQNLYGKTGLPTLTPNTPLGQTLAPAVGDAFASLSAIAPVGRGVVGALDRATIGKPKSFAAPAAPVPTTAELKVAKDALYKAADDANVIIKPGSTRKAVNIFRGVAKSENLGELPTELKKAVDILEKRLDANEPLSLSDADKVRQRINDATKSTDPADQRLGMVVKKQYDAYLDGLGADDVLSGNSKEGIALLKGARELHGRLRRSEMLDEMDALASLKAESNYTQAGHEHAMRKQYEGLTARAIKGDEYLTPEQLAAVRRVAAPGKAANTLRNLGKTDPSRGNTALGLNTVIGGGIGAAVGSLLGPAGAASGAVGGQALLGVGANLANRAALRGTMSRAGMAREALVGRGVTADLPMKQAAPPLTGELMPRQPLALPAPNIISGARSAPGSMYQREQMGMTPDVEAAGMQHPGMARQSVPPPTKALTYQPAAAASDMVVDAQGRVAPSGSQLDAYLRAQRQDGVGAKHPGAAREVPPRKPLALPYLPEQPKPMVVDSQGRAATSAADLNTYLQNMGLNVAKNAGRKKSVFDSVEAKASPSSSKAAPTARSSTQIKLELQRLLVQMRSAPGGGDALYAQGLKRHWDQLQAELRQQLSRESSAGATSQRPTK
jgi:hypothetical protein